MEKKTAEEMIKTGELVLFPAKQTKRAGITAFVGYRITDAGILPDKRKQHKLLTSIVFALATAQVRGTKTSDTIPVKNNIRAFVIPYSKKDMRPVIFLCKGEK